MKIIFMYIEIVALDEIYKFISTVMPPITFFISIKDRDVLTIQELFHHYPLSMF